MCSMFSSKALIFCSKTLIYQIKTILITSFLHYEVTGDNLEHIYIQCDFNHFQPYFLSLFKNFNFGDETCITPHVVGFFLLWWTFDFVDRLTTVDTTVTTVNAPHKNKKYRCHKQTNKHKYLVYMCIFCVDLFHIFQCFQQNHNYVSLLSSVHKLNLIVV